MSILLYHGKSENEKILFYMQKEVYFIIILTDIVMKNVSFKSKKYVCLGGDYRTNRKDVFSLFTVQLTKLF